MKSYEYHFAKYCMSSDYEREKTTRLFNELGQKGFRMKSNETHDGYLYVIFEKEIDNPNAIRVESGERRLDPE